MIAVFWISLFIIFYTFLGYGILLYGLVRLRRLIRGPRPVPPMDAPALPSCTLVVAAYNEEDFIREKIANTLALNYPAEKLSILFISDGSDDRTGEIIGDFPEIIHMHEPQRKGKVAALHRAMGQVRSDIVIFTDANTLLNKDALVNIARHYSDPCVGAVAGEKRISSLGVADAGTAGEGFYWKYESLLKKWDSELYSVVGAAGELFSVRRELYEPVNSDTILDDFMISMLIAKKGFRIIYEPEAYAIESSSENIHEELKRKIRIAAGGMQSIIRLKSLFNVFRFGILSFQYISHRVLRWTLTPFLLIVVFFGNALLAFNPGEPLYVVLMAAQILFYTLACLGLAFSKRELNIKVFFIPFYFCVMNYAVIRGIFRYFLSEQSSAWEKARRKPTA